MVAGRTITTYLDGVQINKVTDSSGDVESLYQVVTRDSSATGDVIVKLVNAQETPVRTWLRLDGASVADKATVTSLTSRSVSDINTLAEPTKTAPVTWRQSGLGSPFQYDVPANSVTVLRFKKA